MDWILTMFYESVAESHKVYHRANTGNLKLKQLN